MTELTKDEEALVDRIEAALIKHRLLLFAHARSGRAYLGECVGHAQRQPPGSYTLSVALGDVTWNAFEWMRTRREPFGLEVQLGNLTLLYSGCKLESEEFPRLGNSGPGNNLVLTYTKDEAI